MHWRGTFQSSLGLRDEKINSFLLPVLVMMASGLRLANIWTLHIRSGHVDSAIPSGLHGAAIFQACHPVTDAVVRDDRLRSFSRKTSQSARIGILLFDHALHFFAFYPGLVWFSEIDRNLSCRTKLACCAAEDCARQITVSDTEDFGYFGSSQAVHVFALARTLARIPLLLVVQMPCLWMQRQEQ